MSFGPNPVILAAVRAASRLRGLPEEAILGRARPREVAEARNLVWYSLYRTGKFSTPMLGQYFGRGHATVLYGLKAAGSALHQQNKMGESIRREHAEITAQINKAMQAHVEQTVMIGHGFKGFWVVPRLRYTDQAGVAWLKRHKRLALRFHEGFLLDLSQPCPATVPESLRVLLEPEAVNTRFLWLETLQG